MNSLNTKEQKQEYNKIPVYYCKRCLSLKVRQVSSMEDLDYCEDCGSTCIEDTDIENWESLYKDKYGHKYLDEYNKEYHK